MGWSCFGRLRRFMAESTARQLNSSENYSQKAVRCVRRRDGIVMRWAQSNQRHNQKKRSPSYHHISTSVQDKSSTEHGIGCWWTLLDEATGLKSQREMKNCKHTKRLTTTSRVGWLELTVVCLLSYELVSLVSHLQSATGHPVSVGALLPTVEGTLIIGDSAFEVQEIHSQIQHNPPLQSFEEIQNDNNHLPNHQQLLQHGHEESSLDIGDNARILSMSQAAIRKSEQATPLVAAPLPPLSGPLISESRNIPSEDITDGDKDSRATHDYEIKDISNASEKDLSKVIPAVSLEDQPSEKRSHGAARVQPDSKAIAGKIVDYELESAGGHNKAKIKKKQKKMKEAEEFKKWGHKKSAEKKAVDMMHKQAEKKKKSEGHKGKKKWGKEVHGHKKKGNFKKKKWGKKIKKGHGLKKGKKGKKFLKDVGHKNTGFKTVYHKEEWGKSSKWHDIDRQKKWDEKSKKWKKNWKKEKGKKYKGNHMKKFEKKKKSGKKYSKKHEDKFKKYKKEEFEKGKKKKMEQKSKKKEGGSKKAAEMMKKKKKKGMY